MAKKNYENKAMSMVDNAKIRLQTQNEKQLDEKPIIREEKPVNKNQDKQVLENDILSKIKEQENKADRKTQKDTNVTINIKINSELNEFMKGERRFKNISSAGYIEYLLQKNESVPELASKETVCVLRDIKNDFPGRNKNYQCAINRDTNEKLEEMARRNRMTKTDYVGYIIYKEYKECNL